MAITPGTRLDVYEVSAKIGKGWMGEVYQARDTKLDRGGMRCRRQNPGTSSVQSLGGIQYPIHALQ